MTLFCHSLVFRLYAKRALSSIEICVAWLTNTTSSRGTVSLAENYTNMLNWHSMPRAMDQSLCIPCTCTSIAKLRCIQINSCSQTWPCSQYIHSATVEPHYSGNHLLETVEMSCLQNVRSVKRVRLYSCA